MWEKEIIPHVKLLFSLDKQQLIMQIISNDFASFVGDLIENSATDIHFTFCCFSLCFKRVFFFSDLHFPRLDSNMS